MAEATVSKEKTSRKQVLPNEAVPLADPGILTTKRVLLAENLDVEMVLSVLKPYLYYSQVDAIEAETNRGSKTGKLIDTLQRLSVKNFNLFNTFLRTVGGVQPDLFSELVGRAPSEEEADWCVGQYAQSLRDCIQAKGHCTDSPLDEHIKFDSEHVQLAIVQDKQEDEKFNELPHRYQNYLDKAQARDSNIPAVEILESVDTESKPKRVLMYGRAGTGKSTTCMWLGREWSFRKWAPQFTVLFLLQLRMLSVSDRHTTAIEMLTLAGLYQVTEAGLVVPLLSWLKHAAGRVLILIDGLDEVAGFAARLQNCPIISDLNQRAHPIDLCLNILRGHLLPGVTVVSASRPFSGLDALRFDRKFEILGLTESRVQEFVYRKHPSKVTDIMEVLTNSPLLMSVCSITFYCALISRLLADGVVFHQEDLQTYTRLMAFLIVQCVERKLPDYCFLIQVSPYFNKLAHMAYLGVFDRQLKGEMTKLVFNQRDIVKAGLTPQDLNSIQEAGLLHVQKQKDGRRSCVSAEFSHFSVQEMLASAYLLVHYPVSDKIFGRLFGGGQFNMSLLYMFGLQCNAGSQWVKSIRDAIDPSDKGFNPIAEQQMNDYIQTLIEKCSSTSKFSSRLQLCQLLYEGQMEDKARSVIKHIVPDGNLTIRHTQLTLIDLMAVWFVCKYAAVISEIDLCNCGVTETLIRFMTSSFLKHSAGNLLKLHLSDNNIGPGGAGVIAAWLQDNNTLQKLYLGSNNIGDNGAAAVAAALQHNSSLHTLHLDYNNIGDNGAAEVAAALQHNSSLHTLHLDYNNIGYNGAAAVAAALQHNSSLHTLYLDNNNTGDSGAAAVAAALQHNSSLHTLYLDDNNIGDNGVAAVAAALQHNSTLTELHVADNHIGEKGYDALRAVKRQGLKIVKDWAGGLL